MFLRFPGPDSDIAGGNLRELGSRIEAGLKSVLEIDVATSEPSL